MKESLFIVRQRDDTRWHVFETGLPRSLASFGLKDDAEEYARELARWASSDDDSQLTREHCESANAEGARRIGMRAAASLAAGAIKKPAMSRV